MFRVFRAPGLETRIHTLRPTDIFQRAVLIFTNNHVQIARPITLQHEKQPTPTSSLLPQTRFKIDQLMWGKDVALIKKQAVSYRYKNLKQYYERKAATLYRDIVYKKMNPLPWRPKNSKIRMVIRGGTPGPYSNIFLISESEYLVAECCFYGVRSL